MEVAKLSTVASLIDFDIGWVLIGGRGGISGRVIGWDSEGEGLETGANGVVGAGGGGDLVSYFASSADRIYLAWILGGAERKMLCNRRQTCARRGDAAYK